MSLYNALFARLKANNEGAFIPFLTLGDPDLETSFEHLCLMVENGADALELGMPFSDPVADGPTIQAATLRALGAGTTPTKALALIRRLKDKYPQLPVGLLTYANLVFAAGIDQFYQDAKAAGVDSVLVADVPIKESAPFVAAAKAAGVAPVMIAPPNASEATLKAVAELSEGYVYLVSRAGVTGTETAAGKPLGHIIDTLKRFESAPVVLGFGIGEPSQVRAALAAGCDGAISGSATVKAAERSPQALARFVEGMKAASR
ncbi:tryptophan synthase subunit alpha [Gallaecimonas xiamenensis]|uniref:Tryptophan synthase alpha chain n=1 Tax=Gallaecimonas xiamenensis 3-C-1 TaxID=745411 RepID=K2JK57_9GAMM|nr:tryptophan synthase subunit alpha [Gallaecimonas xiamenensis]EKE70949.1 tryptophan synthase subunit alpha [Gallaecimonas xiamenensis 3-C-1]